MLAGLFGEYFLIFYSTSYMYCVVLSLQLTQAFLLTLAYLRRVNHDQNYAHRNMKVDTDIAPMLMGLSLTAIILRLVRQSCNHATSVIGNSAI